MTRSSSVYCVATDVLGSALPVDTQVQFGEIRNTKNVRLALRKKNAVNNWYFSDFTPFEFQRLTKYHDTGSDILLYVIL